MRVTLVKDDTNKVQHCLEWLEEHYPDIVVQLHDIVTNKAIYRKLVDMLEYHTRERIYGCHQLTLNFVFPDIKDALLFKLTWM